jgi:hypothetical protein
MRKGSRDKFYVHATTTPPTLELHIDQLFLEVLKGKSINIED